jgi:ACDE family multidrug resistance protein
VTSLYGSVRFFGVAFGPPVFGLLAGRDLKLMSWGPAALTLLAAVLAFFFIEIKDLKKTGGEQKDQPGAGGTDRAAGPGPVIPGIQPARKPVPAGDKKPGGNGEVQ